MRCMILAMIVMTGLTACAGLAKKPELADAATYRLNYDYNSFDDLDLVVSSADKTPVGDIMIPRTTDLGSVVLIKPVLILKENTEESNERD